MLVVSVIINSMNKFIKIFVGEGDVKVIEFKDFSFTYYGEIEPILNDINLKIKTEKCVRIALLRFINGLCSYWWL